MPTSSLEFSSSFTLKIYFPITSKYVLLFHAHDTIQHHDFVAFVPNRTRSPFSAHTNAIHPSANGKNPPAALICSKTLKPIQIHVFFGFFFFNTKKLCLKWHTQTPSHSMIPRHARYRLLKAELWHLIEHYDITDCKRNLQCLSEIIKCAVWIKLSFTAR